MLVLALSTLYDPGDLTETFSVGLAAGRAICPLLFQGVGNVDDMTLSDPPLRSQKLVDVCNSFAYLFPHHALGSCLEFSFSEKKRTQKFPMV